MPATKGMPNALHPQVQRAVDKMMGEPDNTDMIDWQILRAARMPGPSDYDVPGMKEYIAGLGGRLPDSKSPGFIDKIMERANDTPAPNAYSLPGIADTTTGGRMGNSKPKGMLDWVEYYSRDMPGPGYYEVDLERKILGTGASSMTNDPRNLTVELEEKRQRGLPGYHDVETSWSYLKTNSGAKLSKGENMEKSMIEWVEYRAAQTPAPGGTYDVTKSLDYVQSKSKGTRMGKTNIGKRYVELLVEPRAAQTPGPGAYETTKCLEKLGVTCLKEGGGFSMAGRPSLGQLPGKFASMSAASFSNIDIRLERSADHSKVLTPWRDQPHLAEQTAEAGSWANLAKKKPASQLSAVEQSVREAGSFTDPKIRRARRRLTRPKCSSSYLTGAAFTNSINARRRTEAVNNANETKLALGDSWSYAEVQALEGAYRAALALKCTTADVDGVPTDAELQALIEEAEALKDEAKVREAAEKAAAASAQKKKK
eukprot:SAG22_NODE_107_length_19899_cov_24.034141_4_plen_483_part_00